MKISLGVTGTTLHRMPIPGRRALYLLASRPVSAESRLLRIFGFLSAIKANGGGDALATRSNGQSDGPELLIGAVLCG